MLKQLTLRAPRGLETSYIENTDIVETHTHTHTHAQTQLFQAWPQQMFSNMEHLQVFSVFFGAHCSMVPRTSQGRLNQTHAKMGSELHVRMEVRKRSYMCFIAMILYYMI